MERPVQKPPRRRSLRPGKLLRRPTKPLLPISTPTHVVAQRVFNQANNWRTYIIIVIALALFAGLGSALIIMQRTNQTLAAIQQVDPRANQSVTNVDANETDTDPGAEAVPFEPATLREPFTVLLIGVDKREEAIDEGVRSDTLILVRVDPVQNWATMLSVPRDSVVPLPDGSYGKVNRAYSYGFYNAEALYGSGIEPDAGGGAAAAETLERFLNIKVDYIAQVDFYGFENLVDSIGGVILDVQQALVDPEYPTENHGVERVYIAPGLQLMDGRTSLVYARSRHSSNDFDRSKRQQQVLRAVLQQVQSRGIVANMSLLPDWMGVLEQNVRTTLPMKDLRTMTDLAGIASKLDTDRIAQFSINPTDVRVDNVITSDIYWNPTDIAALVRRWRNGTSIEGIVNVQVLNATGIGGLAGRITENLASNGYLMIDPGDGTATAQTILYDNGDHQDVREQLQNELGLTDEQIRVNTSVRNADVDAKLVLVVGADYQESWAGSETP